MVLIKPPIQLRLQDAYDHARALGGYLVAVRGAVFVWFPGAAPAQ